MCFTGKDSGYRFTKSSAIGRRTRNGLVADRPLMACNVKPIRENVAHDGSANFNSMQIAYNVGLLTYSG